MSIITAIQSETNDNYVGITAICSLVLGWKFLDTKYRLQNGEFCVEPSALPAEDGEAAAEGILNTLPSETKPVSEDDQ